MFDPNDIFANKIDTFQGIKVFFYLVLIDRYEKFPNGDIQ